MTSREVSESSRNRNTTACDARSVTTVHADRPARDLLPCQNDMSERRARNSNSRCSSEARTVRASRYSEVSDMSLQQTSGSSAHHNPVDAADNAA